MPLEDGQAAVRGLVMGEGTPYELVDFDPWTRSVRAPSQSPRAWNHGDWSGAEWAEAAVVNWHVCIDSRADENGNCYGQGDFDTWIERRHALSAAMRPIADDTEPVELQFRFGSREYVMYGRPRLVSPDSAWLSWVPQGAVVSTLAFVSLDPLIYSGGEDGLQCATTTLSETIGGARFQQPAVPDHWRFPLRFDAEATGQSTAELTNLGSAPAGLQIRIDGPVQNPRVSLQTGPGQVQRLLIAIDLEVGQWLDIDTAERTVMLNGTASRRGQAVGVFPVLPEGTHEFRFQADNYNDQAQATVCWRSAWY